MSDETLYETYTLQAQEVSDPNAIVRDRDKGWGTAFWQAGDANLPSESAVGTKKVIPKGTMVMLTKAWIEKSGSLAEPAALKYVYAEGWGWTSVGNIRGSLQNHSVGVDCAPEMLSNAPDHFTVGLERAPLLESGSRYPEIRDDQGVALIIPKGTSVKITAREQGYRLSNDKVTVCKVSYTENGVQKEEYTSYSNLDKSEPGASATVTANDAWIRRKVDSYTPVASGATLALGTFVAANAPEQKETGSYVQVFKVEGSPGSYSRGASLGWTNALNLTPGFSTDLKGKYAMWGQVIPDERYDRPKGKDTQGTAKFLGNQHLVMVVDSQTTIEFAVDSIWPKLHEMLSDANAQGKALRLNTGFRSWPYQTELVRMGYPANPPGYSSHQIGLAVDLNNKSAGVTGPLNVWMMQNAWKYGFVQTYPKYREAHHWEYRPDQVRKPENVKHAGKSYTRYYFATFRHQDTDWSRAYYDFPD